MIQPWYILTITGKDSKSFEPVWGLCFWWLEYKKKYSDFVGRAIS